MNDPLAYATVVAVPGSSVAPPAAPPPAAPPTSLRSAVPVPSSDRPRSLGGNAVRGGRDPVSAGHVDDTVRDVN